MAESLQVRILDAFPSGSYSLTAFLRLVDIVETTAIPTAAVECTEHPRLLVNPEFVSRHAPTPQKLLALVMHELHHVLLGHTTFFPRTTPARNFVFDAVINGIVCRMFPRPEYTAFFRDYYSDERFPECLLAPPPGWPGKDVRMAPAVRRLRVRFAMRVHEVHTALYSKAGASYQEVFDLLPGILVKAGVAAGASAEVAAEAAVAEVPLLGDHAAEDGSESRLEHHSPLLFEIVREVVEQWPQPPNPIRGRSLADVLQVRVVAPRPTNRRSRLRTLIQRIAESGPSGRLRRPRTGALQLPTALPHLGRRTLVLRALGAEPLLHEGPVAVRQSLRSGERVHVYLDVSGSMRDVVPALYGAVLDCADSVHPTVHLFSTLVADISLRELRSGTHSSTGGTDIGCVAAHMAKHRVRRALIVTDGFVGKPMGAHRDTLAKACIAVAYLGRPCNKDDLRDVARHTLDL
ncbi:MAG: hypothetical protein RIT25_1646 [Planctomycetota bacterium]